MPDLLWHPTKRLIYRSEHTKKRPGSTRLTWLRGQDSGLRPSPLTNARNKFLRLCSLRRTCDYCRLTPSSRRTESAHGQNKNPTGVGLLFWLRGQDSNLRPRGYEPRELPLLHPAPWWSEHCSKQRSKCQLRPGGLAVQKEVDPRLEVLLIGWLPGRGRRG